MMFPTSLAFVEAFHVSKEGLFVDLVMADGTEGMTARWFSPYTGHQFGLYAPPAIDDEVCVVCPSGDPSEGLVAFARSWSPSHEPPTRALDHKEDIVLTVKKDKNLWIEVSGSANIYLLPGDGKVKIGGENGLEPAVLGNKLQQFITDQQNFNTQHIHNFTYSAGPAIGTPGTTVVSAGPAVNDPGVRAQKVEVK